MYNRAQTLATTEKGILLGRFPEVGNAQKATHHGQDERAHQLQGRQHCIQAAEQPAYAGSGEERSSISSDPSREQGQVRQEVIA